MKESNHHFSFSISINSNKEHVWQILTDVKHWPDWDTELIEASINGQFEEGANGVLKPKTGPVLKFYISKVVPNLSYTIDVVMPVGKLIMKRSLICADSQVHFTDDIKFTGILKYLFGFALGRTFKKVLPDVMNNFKKIAEIK